MHYTELFSHAGLRSALDEGLVKSEKHPTFDLWIYNYTAKATYSSTWNDVTRHCRGLIVDDAGHIVARALPKFFNHGQSEAASIGLGEWVIVTDKLDGSLGVLHHTPDGPAISTRGSFVSEQARHATAWLRKRRPEYRPLPGMTSVFEIIYPKNRVVLDYGDRDELVFLCNVDHQTGRLHYPKDVPFTLAQSFQCYTFADALKMTPRPNAEGIVVYSLDTGAMLKIKQEDYVRLHRIISGLSSKSVWEHAMTGANIEHMLEKLPDEFHEWTRKTHAEFVSQCDWIVSTTKRTFDVLHGLTEHIEDPRERRKAFAKNAMSPLYESQRRFLFELYDGKDIAPSVMMSLKPVGVTAPRNITTEDNA